jgi:hypothetical protein
VPGSLGSRDVVARTGARGDGRRDVVSGAVEAVRLPLQRIDLCLPMLQFTLAFQQPGEALLDTLLLQILATGDEIELPAQGDELVLVGEGQSLLAHDKRGDDVVAEEEHPRRHAGPGQHRREGDDGCNLHVDTRHPGTTRRKAQAQGKRERAEQANVSRASSTLKIKSC